MANKTIMGLDPTAPAAMTGLEQLEYERANGTFGRLGIKDAVEKFAPAGGAMGAKPWGFAVIGDSISQSQTNWELSWAKKVEFFSGGAYRLRLNPSVGGYTMEQVRDLLVPQVLALNPLPREVVISAITNNLGSDAGYTSAITSHKQIIDALVARGVQPVLWTAPPQLTPDRQARTALWNQRIWAMSRLYGYKVIDPFSFYVNPATGLAKSEYFADELHPNAIGHTMFAKSIITSPPKQNLLTQEPITYNTSSNVDAANLIQNPLMLEQWPVGSGIAMGWNESPNFNGTKQVAPMGDGSNGQTVTHAAGTTPEGYIGLTIDGLQAGHKYLVMLDASWSMPAGYTGFIAGFMMSIANASWGHIDALPVGMKPVTATESGRIFYEFTAPAGAAHATLAPAYSSPAEVLAGGPLTITVSRPSLVDLTQLAV